MYKLSKKLLLLSAATLAIAPVVTYAETTHINMYTATTEETEPEVVDNIVEEILTPTPNPTILNSSQNETLSAEDQKVIDEYDVQLLGDGTYLISAYKGTEVQVRIPNTFKGKNITAIETNAFKGKGLTSVQIPDTITVIGNSAFLNNTLTSVVLPSNLRMLGNDAFANNKLINVSIPTNISAFGTGVFANNQLSSIAIPSTLTSIPANTFANNNFTEISIPSNINSIGDRAFINNKIYKLELKKGIQSIGASAFENSYITSLYLPTTVNMLSPNAFTGNPISSLTIPKRLSSYVSNMVTDVKNMSNLNLYEEANDPGKDTSPIKEGEANKIDVNGNKVNGFITSDIFTVGLEAGNLVMQKPLFNTNSFGTIKLGGNTIKSTIDIVNDIIIADTRGTDEGWSLTVSATPFQEVPKRGGLVPEGGWKKLPEGSLALTGVGTVYKLDNNRNKIPVTSELKVNTDNSIIIDSGAVTLVETEGKNSFGIWGIDFPTNALELTIVPMNGLIDKDNYPNQPTPYTSTITWTLIAGPGK